MLVINYRGITPQNNFYSFGVKANNKANKIKFVLSNVQDFLTIGGFTPYLKVQSKEHEYIDKIELESSVVGNNVEMVWEMTRKSTQYRNLELQLQFQSNDDDEIVWQSMIVLIELCETIPADKVISEKYPSELEHLEKSVANKQDKLVSGKNIKTINGKDILGSGNLNLECVEFQRNTYTIQELYFRHGDLPFMVQTSNEETRNICRIIDTGIDTFIVELWSAFGYAKENDIQGDTLFEDLYENAHWTEYLTSKNKFMPVFSIDDSCNDVYQYWQKNRNSLGTGDYFTFAVLENNETICWIISIDFTDDEIGFWGLSIVGSIREESFIQSEDFFEWSVLDLVQSLGGGDYSIPKIITLTQTEYDNITSKRNDVYYFIKED